MMDKQTTPILTDDFGLAPDSLRKKVLARFERLAGGEATTTITPGDIAAVISVCRQADQMDAVLTTFVERVENGEVISRRTYAAANKALGR